MTLPDATQIASAVTFVTNIWSAFSIAATLFAVVAVLKLAPYILKAFTRMLPGGGRR